MDMYFTRAGLEQASGEVIAGHRMARYAGAGLVADLCCGIGGDLTALAAGRRALAVDRDPLRLRMALANAQAYGVAAGVTAVAADVREAMRFHLVTNVGEDAGQSVAHVHFHLLGGRPMLWPPG